MTAGIFLINVLSRRPLEDTTRDRELLEKCLELFEVMEKRGHTESILLCVLAPPGLTGSYSSSSSIIGGIIRDPNFDPLGPNAGRGEGGRSNLVVNAKKSRQHPIPTDAASSDSSGPSSAGATGGEMGFDCVGLDMTFI